LPAVDEEKQSLGNKVANRLRVNVRKIGNKELETLTSILHYTEINTKIHKVYTNANVIK